jgi:hypothetical protein
MQEKLAIANLSALSYLLVSYNFKFTSIACTTTIDKNLDWENLFVDFYDPINVNLMIEEHAFPSFFDLAYFLFSRFDCKGGKKNLLWGLGLPHENKNG